ncbi:MAG: glycosyltransferase family 39 protein [Anaerolineae bacterium]|nr:glycosyltransferase family 39 protein [Anaerolineae bacterium]
MISTIETETQSARKPHADILIVILFSLVLRGVLFYLRYREYLLSGGSDAITAFGGSDVPGWLGMARHLNQVGDFSYWLMGLRPPLFPATVALVLRLGGNTVHAAILQTLFGVVTPVLGYLLALRLFSRSARIVNPHRLALLAGIVMAFDPASVSSSVVLLSEPLFNLLFIATLLHLTIFIQESRWWHLAFAALWLALAMLTRSTMIYFWAVAPFILVPLVKKWWRPALVLMVVSLGVYLGWSVRNLRYQGLYTYSTQANFSLLFLRAASAEHLATDIPMDDIYVTYVRELYQSVGDEESAAKAEAEDLWHFLVADSPEIYAAMGQMARAKLIEYWPAAIAATGIGAWRVLFVTNVFPGWFKPVEIAYHFLLYGLMLWGVWCSIRSRDWPLFLIAGVPIVYMIGLTLVAQTSAMDTRMRTPVSGPIIILAAYGLSAVLAAIRVQRKAVVG